MKYSLDFAPLASYWPVFINGAWLTLKMTALAVVVGVCVGTLVAFAKRSQIKPGTHLACMGTDTKGKQEVEAELVAAATLFTDEVAQSISIGECQHAIGQGLIRQVAVTPLGEVINGNHPGRSRKDEITLFDGTGVGLQDLAVASAVVDLAIAEGVAIHVEF